jgi:hypothetical protein
MAAPVGASERDVELAGLELPQGGAQATPVAPPELAVRRRGSGRLEDPRPGQPAFAKEVDHDRSARRCQLVEDLVVDGDQVARPGQQPLTVGRERHPSGRPDEQAGAQLVLEPADLAADRLLRDVQPLRRPGEAQLLGDRDEVAQGPDLEVTVADRSDRTHAFRMLVQRDRVLDLGTPGVEAGQVPMRPSTPPPTLGEPKRCSTPQPSGRW